MKNCTVGKRIKNNYHFVDNKAKQLTSQQKKIYYESIMNLFQNRTKSISDVDRDEGKNI